jgi:transposase
MVRIHRALALNPNSATAWSLGGWVYVYAGQPKMAVAHLQRAMPLNTWAALSQAFMQLERDGEALDRRVLNGIFRVLRSGAPWRELPKSLGPHNSGPDHEWPGGCSRCGRALLSRPRKSRLWPSKRKELSMGKLQLVDGNCRQTVRLLPKVIEMEALRPQRTEVSRSTGAEKNPISGALSGCLPANAVNSSIIKTPPLLSISSAPPGPEYRCD